MRGLKIQVMLVEARALALTNSASAELWMAMAEADAFRLGKAEAELHVHTLPGKFDDEPTLAERWTAGQKHYALGFDEANWRARCGWWWEEGAGAFSTSVDFALRLLPVRDHAEALAIATEFGYEDLWEGRNSISETLLICEIGSDGVAPGDIQS